MKVTIKDREYLSRIEPDDLERFLIKNNFEFDSDKLDEETDEVIGKVYSIYSSEHHCDVYVEFVNDPQRIDYIAYITSALMYLEKALGESQLQIYVDITGDEIFFIPKEVEHQITDYLKDMMPS